MIVSYHHPTASLKKMPSITVGDILYIKSKINESVCTQTMSNADHIPVAHNLICPGNPAMKARAAKKFTVPSHLEELNSRIDDIENAIGQKTNSPVGRAFAIRAEKSCDKDSDASVGHLYPKNHKTNSSSNPATIKDQELV